MKEQFVSMLREFDYAEDEIAALSEYYEKMMASDTVRADMEGFLSDYTERGELDVKRLKELSQAAADAVGIHEYSARLVYFLLPVPHCRKYFDAEGLGYDEWYGSMIDMKWKLRECLTVYGIYGTFVDWFGDFFFARRVAFGRLQFNLTKVPADFASGDIDIKKGDLALAIHIPTDSRTPFTKENRMDAYRRAEKYFAKFFPGGKVLLSCGTWLFNPAHENILPESSNIRSFMSEFVMDDGTLKHGNDNAWRIFGRGTRPYDENADALPEDTSMMRAYKKHMQNGGFISTRYGYMYLD